VKYTVVCPYCGKNYIVESEHNESFTCPGCGGLGCQSDIIHRDYESDRIHQAARLLLRQHLKDNAEEKEEAINSYKARRPEAFMDAPDESITESVVTHNVFDTIDENIVYDDMIGKAVTTTASKESSDTSLKIGVFVFLFTVFIFFLTCISESFTIHKQIQKNSKQDSVQADNTASSVSNTDNNNAATNASDKSNNSGSTHLNTSADTENIRIMLDTLITATAQNDYDTILDNISGPDEYPWINTYDWFTHYLNTSLGKYLGDESIEFIDATYIKICQWNDSHRDAFFYQKAFYYKVELSDGSKETICVGLTFNDKWVLGLDIDTYTDMLLFTEFAVPCNETYNESVPTSFIVNGYDMVNYTEKKPQTVYTYRDETSTEKERFLIFDVSHLLPGEQTIIIDVGSEHYEQTLEISSAGRYYID